MSTDMREKAVPGKPLEIHLPELRILNVRPFREFLQMMADRLFVGHCRYDRPDAAKQYESRLQAELTAYRRTGNREHLINAAVYAYLESRCPENQKSHFNPLAQSVTRRNFGGCIDIR